MNEYPGLVATLAYDGLCSFEFGIALEVFALPRSEFDFPWYRHVVVGVDQGPMRAANGVTLLAEYGLEQLAQADTIIIPGWRGNDVMPPQPLIDALRSAYARGARFITIAQGFSFWLLRESSRERVSQPTGVTVNNSPSAILIFRWMPMCCMSTVDR